MINVSTDELFFALSVLKDIAPAKSHQPIYKNVLFLPGVNTIDLIAYDNDKYASFQVAAEISEYTERFMVPLENIHQLIGALKRSEETVGLRLTPSGKSLDIVNGDGTKTTFRLQDAGDFPAVLNLTMDKEATVNPEDFVECLSLSAFAQHESIVLQSLHIMVNQGVMTVEACNTVSGGRMFCEVSSAANFDIAVPATIEKPLRKLASLGDVEWRLWVSDKHLALSGDRWIIAFRRLDAEYFDLSVAYNNSCANVLLINKDDLLADFRVLSSVLTSGNKNIKFEAEGTAIVLSVSSELGEASRRIEVSDTILVKNMLVLDVLQMQKILLSMRGNTARIELGTGREPVLFRDIDDIFFTYPR